MQERTKIVSLEETRVASPCKRQFSRAFTWFAPFTIPEEKKGLLVVLDEK